MSTTLSIIRDTHRIKKSNKYPVKLRVTFESSFVIYTLTIVSETLTFVS